MTLYLKVHLFLSFIFEVFGQVMFEMDCILNIGSSIGDNPSKDILVLKLNVLANIIEVEIVQVSIIEYILFKYLLY